MICGFASPFLNPIELIVPEWPAGERGVAHPVEVLVTINAGGAVVDAEALTGTEQARAAAVSTVRQSTFRPVIRDGRPVAAYTSVSVPVVNVSTTKLELNVRDELAAATRVAALERAWPRSAEQVFLDLNNDLEGADPFMRQAFLPQLAKAALKAGRIGDAERYATEVLGDTGPHVDGDAVHDGHSVLGLLALERADVDEAKRQLIQAGSTMGSPVLSSFGPDLALARRLLEAGERDAVLEYLSLCEKFWTSGRPRIQRWIETISAGGTPDLRTIQF